MSSLGGAASPLKITRRIRGDAAGVPGAHGFPPQGEKAKLESKSAGHVLRDTSKASPERARCVAGPTESSTHTGMRLQTRWGTPIPQHEPRGCRATGCHRGFPALLGLHHVPALQIEANPPCFGAGRQRAQRRAPGSRPDQAQLLFFLFFLFIF